MAEITLIATIDAFTWLVTRPTTNFGGNPILAVSSGADAQKAYVWFPVPVPLGSAVRTATLKVYLAEAWASGPHTITARRITSTWAENTLTTLNEPTVTATNQATAAVTDGVAGQEVTLDVTNMIVDVAGGAAWYGIRLELDTTNQRLLHSSESIAVDLTPRLVVDYGLEPDIPRNLRPSGGRAIAPSLPTLSWDYLASDGPQAMSRVQVHTSPDFTTPAYDSGWVANTTWNWLYAGTALTDNTAYYWRVAVRDSMSQESDWSEIALFERRTHGVLTITAPSPDGANVDELTPTFTHTFTGRTQQRVQHFIHRRSGPTANWTLWFNDQAVVSNVTSYELAEPLPSATDEYRMTLRVWDTISRDTVPGDPGYVDATRTFDYVPTAGVNPVTNLAVTSDGPRATITWQRASAPDFFHLILDGSTAEAFILPGDVQLDATHYSFDYWAIPPNVATTVEVIAVVNLASSASNPSVDVTLDFTGVWLVAPDDDLYIRLVRTDIRSTIGEEGTTYFPRGRRDPVRLRGMIRGYEGSVSGSLTDAEDRTTAEQLADFYAIKELAPGARVRLIYGERSFPVLIGAAESVGWGTPEERYTVTFEYWQTGEYDIEVPA